MGNDAEKKAGLRVKAVWRLYGGLTALATLIQIALQVFHFKVPVIAGLWSCLGLATLAVAYALCIAGKLSEAATGVGADVYTDLFAVVILTQIGVLWSKWAWLFLTAFPAYGIYLLRQMFAPLMQQAQNEAVATAVHNAAVAVNKEEKGKRMAGRSLGQRR